MKKSNPTKHARNLSDLYLFLFVMLIVLCGGGYYLFSGSKKKQKIFSETS